MEIALLSITLFVIGFGLGSMVFAPLSELLEGKLYPKNTETLFVCRLIDCIAFSAPMTFVGGTLADLWRTEERGVPMAAFSAVPFIGPAIGPLVGGFLSEAGGWRWLYTVQLLFSGVAYPYRPWDLCSNNLPTPC
ncbi:major facilitator superfamily domain-containing protein [Tirmania nivea]|nr:major facilitator superfamily domain-containing protein [Tirmania nivea]